MSQENVEVVRLAYAAVSEGNLDTLVEVTAPDAVLDFSRSIGPQKGTYRGREAFGRYIAGIAEAFERFQLSPVDFVVAVGGEIVVRHHVSAKGRASGLEIDRVPDVALVWELRDGRVIKTTMYQPHAEASKPSGCGSRRSRRRTWILRDGTGSLRAKAPTTKSFALSRRMWSGTTTSASELRWRASTPAGKKCSSCWRRSASRSGWSVSRWRRSATSPARKS
jgi:ketosteroid isomerase-like protein